MDERSDHTLIAELIASAATASDAGPSDLVTKLTTRYWPGGSDGSNAIAAEWLRRWQPKCVLVAPLQCVCPAGHCQACN
jgi:hypothetical protein